MKNWHSSKQSFEQIVKQYGPWSAMSIRLPDGSYTREPAVDRRLKRILQAAADLSPKPLNECRVLDLACLEGQYGIEFALQGAEVVCIEIREANLVKTAYAVDRLGLKNCRIVQDDVRNLSVAAYGEFDIIVCSGILYHLPAEDAYRLIKQIHDCCRNLCIVDTYVAMTERVFADINGKRYGGVSYTEHAESATAKEKIRDMWASIDNSESFWFAYNHLTSVFAEAGFTFCADVILPTHQETYDRRNFVAIKGRPVGIKSSPLTDQCEHIQVPMPDPMNLHPNQTNHGWVFRVAKTLLPPKIKEMIKPSLRKIGVLKTPETPPWS